MEGALVDRLKLRYNGRQAFRMTRGWSEEYPSAQNIQWYVLEGLSVNSTQHNTMATL
jgi:hypothetical protein